MLECEGRHVWHNSFTNFIAEFLYLSFHLTLVKWYNIYREHVVYMSKKQQPNRDEMSAQGHPLVCKYDEEILILQSGCSWPLKHHLHSYSERSAPIYSSDININYACVLFIHLFILLIVYITSERWHFVLNLVNPPLAKACWRRNVCFRYYSEKCTRVIRLFVVVAFY